ncbi:isoprenylcysteine carboxylmethyltransferase family protein [Fusibacter sp. 3D3]|uniref:methyltransferase family protein n=1 Tax=Fusibacter sp. 3D3 TaxID=1048380 RepID=UPI0008532E25|nr:isoprenylcysteine carboxylmethyltransferase family protein [Fusibacter sp. 3D3]GAU79301.1 putative protein-S-isoprenylcysteine methyltransferase [Fusibacter sp. 3D3]
MIFKIAAVMIILLFYLVYITKMVVQKRKGIQTDQIAKGNKEKSIFVKEAIMKTATYSIVLVQFISILGEFSILSEKMRYMGLVIGLIGDLVFTISVWTMRDSWRAGIPEKDETKMITDGIYSMSRNPAFLGFDLMYFGLLLLFFNWVLLVFSIGAMFMLHLQILSEEQYLEKVFGKPYEIYRSNVRRYFGRSA